MDYLKAIVLILLMLSIATSMLSIRVYSQSFSSIIIDVYYDLYSGFGYVNQTLVLSDKYTGPGIVEIPLLKPPENGYYEVVGVYGDLDGNLSYSVSGDRVIVLFNRSRTIHVDYLIYNYSSEISVDTYSLPVDLMDFKNTSYFQLNMIVPGGFKAFVEPREDSEVKYIDDSVKVTLTKPLYYVVVFYSVETTPVPSTSETTQPGGLFSATYLIAAGIVAGSVAAVLYLLYRRRFGAVELETLPSSILEDDTTKQLILALGDAGEQGVKQSELVRITGRPKSSISRRVRRLVEEGYVTVIRRGKHNIVKLTSKGLEAYRDLKKRGGEK